MSLFFIHARSLRTTTTKKAICKIKNIDEYRMSNQILSEQVESMLLSLLVHPSHLAVNSTEMILEKCAKIPVLIRQQKLCSGAPAEQQQAPSSPG